MARPIKESSNKVFQLYLLDRTNNKVGEPVNTMLESSKLERYWAIKKRHS